MYQDKHNNEMTMSETWLALELSEASMEVAVLTEALARVVISNGLITKEDYRKLVEDVRNDSTIKAVTDMLAERRKELEENQKKEDRYKEHPEEALEDLFKEMFGNADKSEENTNE